MHHHFKQAVCLQLGNKRKDYTRGGHDLSEQDLELLSKCETFSQYKKLGLIAEANKPITSDFVADRNKAIAEKVLAKAEEKIEAPVEAESASSMDESSIEAAAEEVKEQASSKKKKR